MATFTVSLKRAIELTGGELDYSGPIVKMTGGDIGLNKYVLFDEDYRDTLNGKIVDHFFNREIAHESLDIFQLKMRSRMNEIMPVYNKLYELEKLEFDPLSTVDIRTLNDMQSAGTRDGETSTTSDTESESTSTNEAGSRTVSSEFPQTMLNNSGDYATSASDANSTSGSTGSGHDQSTVQGTESTTDEATQSAQGRTTGYQGVPSDILVRYRESLIDIDLMVIADLEPLFMFVYDTGDEYASHYRSYYL